MELPFQVLRETVIAQYVLALAMVMERIPEVPEGRANWFQRLQQEIEYRRWRVRGDDSGVMLFHLPRMVLENYESRVAYPPIDRRDFVSPELALRRGEIAERLWQIFLEYAKINACERILAPSPFRGTLTEWT